MNLSAIHIEVHAGERRGGAEALLDAAKSEARHFRYVSSGG
jgi:hypothetical protein